MTPCCNTLACKSEVVHSFANHDLRAFGAKWLNVLVGEKGPHSMASYASGGPIIGGQWCEVVRQFFLVVAIEKLMTRTGRGPWASRHVG